MSPNLTRPSPPAAGRRLVVWWAVAVLLAGVGGVLVGVGIASQQHAPQPTAAQANPATAPVITVTTTATVTPSTPTSSAEPLPQSTGLHAPSTAAATTPRSTTSAPTPTTAPTSLTLRASVPLSIAIPSIGVQSTLLQLGLNADKSIEVPPLEEPDSQAGWYKYSPTPGQIGPAVILGHVDSVQYGPGVFFRLGALEPGAAVNITLTNRVVAVFTVNRVVSYPKSAFPSAAVYGEIDQPGLRLITCGGTFDPQAGSYESNIVAYATLTSSHSTP